MPAVLLTACGDDDTNGEATATTAAESVSSNPETTGGDGGFESVVEAANEEGSVVAYVTAMGLEQMDALEQAFESEYPEIDLQLIRELPQDVQAKVEAEIQTGRGIADVVQTGDTLWLDKMSEEGNLEPIDFPNLDADGYKDEFVQNTYFLASAAVTGWGWNTELLPEGIQDEDDFLNPELEGRIGVVDPTHSILVDTYLSYEEHRGDGWVESIAAMKPRIYGSTLQIAEGLASGEIAASIYVVPLEPQMAAGAPVDYKIPDNAWTLVSMVAQPVSSPHPNAARVFMNYLLTPEAQSVVSSDSVSVLPDVEGTIGYIGDYPIRDPGAITPEQVEEYQARFDGLFR